MRLRLVIVAIGVLTLHLTTAAQSHVVPTDQIGHHIQIAVFRDSIVVDYTIVQSELADIKEMIAMNTDGDFEIADEEREAYHRQRRSKLKGHLKLLVDGQRAELKDVGTVDASAAQLRSHLFSTTAAERHDSVHEVSLYNGVPLTRAENLRYYVVLADSMREVSRESWNNATGADRSSARTDREDRGMTLRYAFGEVSGVSVGSTGVAPEPGEEEGGAGDRLREMIRTPNPGIRFVVISLIVSAILGGLHALARATARPWWPPTWWDRRGA